MFEGKAKHNKLVLEKESYMDVKREKEFELIMLDEQNQREVQRGEVRLEDMRQKIQLLKLNQEKIKKESKFVKLMLLFLVKELQSNRFFTDEQHEGMKGRFL